MNKINKEVSFFSGKKVKKKTVLIISFVILSILFSSIICSMCFSQMNRRVENTNQYIIAQGEKIKYAIESRVTVVKALEMYTKTHDGSVEDFEMLAEYYFRDDPALRSIQLAPNGVITSDLTYPEPEIKFEDHDLFADPERKADVIRSKETGEIILSGPYDLKQGGRGIILRDPIYLENEDGEEEFWGFSIVVFNVPQVFNIEQMNLLSDENYFFRVWRYEPDTEERIVVVENTDAEMTNAISQEIEILGDTWYLDIVPQDKWLPRGMLHLLILIFSVILMLAMFAISGYLKNREMVYCDSLLNIGNINALSAYYNNLPANKIEKMYIVAFDIDKFKEFNYLYGVDGGDRLLRYIAKTTQEEMPGTRLFRYAFDYFILMGSFVSLEQCEEKLRQILTRFEEDIDAGVVPPFEISAGIRKIYRGEKLQLSINDALIAREMIKGNALRHFAVYDEEIRNRRLNYMEMEAKLPTAIENEEFHVFYQPKYDMITGELVGSEALVRWISPDGSMLSPAAFIPCFEDSHQICMLDEIVLKKVCRKIHEMVENGMQIKPVSVNLSRVHLKQSDFLPKMKDIIEEYQVDPAMLSFEITESVIYEDSIPLREIVEYLHSLGCKVDMDDYGVGVSGPKSLASYKFDTVKFDKSFVDDINNPKVADIVRTTSHLVKDWGMSVVVEGVETKEQAKILVDLGCTVAQGYYYAKPMPEEEYERLLKRTAENDFHDEIKVNARPNIFSDDVRAIFDSNLLPIYIIDPKSYRVVYCNQAMQKVLGGDVTGELCYEKMRGQSEPCKSCSAMRLWKDGDGTPKEHLSKLGSWTMVQASVLHWQGWDYVQITCMDITKQKKLEEKLYAQYNEIKNAQNKKETPDD